MTDYRIIEAKDEYGCVWYFPQKKIGEIWTDLDGKGGWINIKAAMASIRKDVTGKVAWQGTSDDIQKELQANKDSIDEFFDSDR